MNEWMKLMFGPFWAGNRLCARFEGDGGGEGGAGGGAGSEGGDGDVAGPDWLHEDFELSDLASNPDVRKSMSKYKSHAEQVRGHVELQKQYRNSFRVPNSLDDAKPEEVAKITGRLKGILKPEHVRALVDAPDKPDGYELVRPKMPEGLEYDEASEASLRAWGVKHCIGKEAVAELHQMLTGSRIEAHNAEVTRLQQLWADTRKEMVDRHGEQEWNRREDLAGKMLKEWGNKAGVKGDDIIAALLETGSKEKMAPLLAAIAELATVAQAEGSTRIGRGGGGGSDEINVAERWPNSKQVMES